MIQFTVPDFYEKGQFNLAWLAFMKMYPDILQPYKVDVINLILSPTCPNH